MDIHNRFDIHIEILNHSTQRGREHWAVSFTGTQSFITTISYSLAQKLWVPLINFYWLVPSMFQTFQQVILIHKNGNFVHHYWGNVTIYCSLSYPLRSLKVEN